ncbi:dnaJ homolog subfamily C member 4 isoform X2 [Cottoperca gobio]|uniref:DnaJ homolog subfamily C member 4 isoform X2 n=1 Tax=Cottoperca gobio TaxID=56716 RepID=A0A6J2QJ63_COTGO|nr:dnaJ homolog subfamily C member 4 isoform X2 [Cottoperca gobio]
MHFSTNLRSVLTVCFHVVAPSVNKDVHVYLPCGTGIIECGVNSTIRKKSMVLHPDSDLSNPALHSQFVELSEAYRVLSKAPSRKEYDFKIRHPHSGGQVFRSNSSHASYKASTNAQDNSRYWEQFHQSQAPEMTADNWQKRRKKKNLHIVGYCVLTMLLGIGVHIVFFRKLEKVHNNYMDEKDRVITNIYNESKERARVNGFKKQTEILRQKHAEFLEKYKIRKDGDDK